MHRSLSLHDVLVLNDTTYSDMATDTAIERASRDENRIKCEHCRDKITPDLWLSISAGTLGELYFCRFSCMWIFSHPDKERSFDNMSPRAREIEARKQAEKNDEDVVFDQFVQQLEETDPKQYVQPIH